MAEKCYKKLMSEVFGPQLAENNPVADAALRSLKPPSLSCTFRPYLNFAE